MKRKPISSPQSQIVVLWDQYEQEDDEDDNPFKNDYNDQRNQAYDIEANHSTGTAMASPSKKRFSMIVRDEIESIRNRIYYRPVNDTKQKVIGEIADDIDQINLIKQYRLKYTCATFFCFLTTILGGLALIFGLAVTDLFNNRKKNNIVIGCSSICFIPLLLWIRCYCFPTKLEQEKNEKSKIQMIRQGKMRKKRRFLDKGQGDKYRLDDEYIAEDNVIVPRVEYMATSKNRGNFYDSIFIKQSFDGEKFREVLNYSEDNGYMNDYYFRHIMYKDALSGRSILGDQLQPTASSSAVSSTMMPIPGILEDKDRANIRIWGGDPIAVEAAYKKRRNIIMPSLRARNNRVNFDASSTFDDHKLSPGVDVGIAAVTTLPSNAVLNQPVSSPKSAKKSSQRRSKSKLSRRNTNVHDDDHAGMKRMRSSRRVTSTLAPAEAPSADIYVPPLLLSPSMTLPSALSLPSPTSSPSRSSKKISFKI